MSPIRLHPVSLTHPQTPINRSLSKAFQDIQTSWERRPRHQDILGERPSHLEHKQHQRRFISIETLLESSPDASNNFKNFDVKCKEHSKQNHLNYMPRSQGSLESARKPQETPRNHKLVNLNRSKPLKSRRTSTINLQIRRTFEEKSSKSYSQISKFTGIKLKSLKKPHKPQISEVLRIQASKTSKNFHHKSSKTKNTRRT